MEAVAVIAIIVVLCICLGVKLQTILVFASFLLAAAVGLLLLTFVVMNIILLFTKKKKGYFVRIGKDDRQRFDAAYYMVDGRECRCIFPSEPIMKSRIYSADKEYTLHVTKSGRVFDKTAVRTCLTGLITSSLLAAAAAVIFCLV